MAKRTIFAYLYRGGVSLDIPNGCWVRGLIDFGSGDVGDALMLQIRAAAGQTMPINAPLGSKWILSDYDELPGEGGRFGKDWFVSTTGGKSICAYVDVDSSLNITTCPGLKSMFKQSSSTPTLWKAPYILAYGAGDCMATIHASHFKGQVWWVQSAFLSSRYTTGQTSQVSSTSPSAGQTTDWVTPKTQVTGKTQIPISGQHFGVPASVINLQTGQATRQILPGPDGRTWALLRGARTANADDGQGDDWKVGNGTSASNYQAAANSGDGSPYLPRTARYAGRSLPQITMPGNSASAGVISCSDVVRSDDGTLYQLLFTSSYTRIVPAKQAPVPPTGERGEVPDTTIPPSVILNDPATSNPQRLYYTVAVPNDLNKIQYVQFTYLDQLFAHRPIKGKLNDPTKPTKISFDIPAWPDIPAYTQVPHAFNPTNNPYDGSSYFQVATVYCNFTYASTTPGFYFNIGRKYDAKSGPNAEYLGDPPPAVYNPAHYHSLQVSSSTPGYSAPIEGRGEFGFQPRPFPYLDGTNKQQLSFPRCFDADMARGGTVTYDVQLFGDPGKMAWKDCYLAIDYIDPINYNYQTHIISGSNGSLAPPLPTNTTATVLDGEFSAHTNYTPSYDSGVVYNPFMNEINAQYGQQYNFSLRFLPGQNANGTPRRFFMTILDQFVQFTYNLSAPDFFLVRSRDSGATWEFAADCKPVAGLSHLRDFNNTTNRFNFGQPLVPSLIAEENNIFLVWIFAGTGQNGGPSEAHPVKTLGSQDCGETWTVGNSFVPMSGR